MKRFLPHRIPHVLLAALPLLVALLAAAPARAQSFRYSLATEQEFGAKRGFKLFFEDTTEPVPRKLGTLRLLLGVGTGTGWRFPEFKTEWQWDRDYQVKAVIGEKGADMFLDGKLLGQSPGGFTPAQDLDVLKSGLDSRFTNGTTEYMVRMTSLRVTTNRGQKREFTFPDETQRPGSVFAFDPQTPIVSPFKLSAGEYPTIEASFKILHVPDLRANAPFVDRYGQSVHSKWTGKVRDDADIKKSAADEKARNAAWGTPSDYDAFGGYKAADWKEKPSGYFRTTRRNGFWWLVSPEGNPCFYVGVDTVIGSSEKTAVAGREFLFTDLPPKDGEFAAAWGRIHYVDMFSFPVANLIRKYGQNWEEETWRSAGRRLKTWGFSGAGKWSGVPDKIAVPAQPVLRREGVPTLGRLPDVFDPKIRAALRASLEKGIAPNRKNPYVIGWSFMNEHDEIVLKSEIEGILKKPATVPAKVALVTYALEQIYGGDTARMAAAWKVPVTGADPAAARQALDSPAPQPPAADIETLRRFFADRYYDFVYRTVKDLDPNHLYFGFWISPGWWENEEDWNIMARHVDVIGYDTYAFRFADARLARLLKQADKPALCGEFSFPSWYDGTRGSGIYGTATKSDAESGRLYADWVSDAARNPYCIGVDWFQYRDQPITGRDPKGAGLVWGENYAFGLVDITDRPKWDMIAPMREINLQAAGIRLEATRAGGRSDYESMSDRVPQPARRLQAPGQALYGPAFLLDPV